MLLKVLVLGAFAALSSAVLRADPIATLSCQGGNAASLTVPVFYFSAGVAGSASSSATLGVDFSAFPVLAASAAPLTYAACTLTGGTTSLVFNNVLVNNVTANGSGAGVNSVASEIYTTINLGFGTLLSSGPLSSSGLPSFGTFSCQSAQGGSFSSSVYALASNPDGALNAVDIALLPTLSAAVAAQTKYTCNFSSGSAGLVFSGVVFTEISATGYGAGIVSATPQLYANGSFSYTSLSTSGTATYPGQAPIATISCQTTQGASLLAPVYLFGGTSFALDFASYPAVAAAAAANTLYATCTLDDGFAPITLTNATIAQPSVGASGLNGASVTMLYTTANLNYASISAGGSTIPGPPHVSAAGSAHTLPVAASRPQ